MAKDASDVFSNPTDLRLKDGKATLTNSLGKSDQLDFYRIRINRRSNFRATLQKQDDDADLTLFKTNRERVARSNNDDEDDELINTQLDSGTYILRVARQEGKSNKYELNVSVSSDAGNGFGQATRIRPTTGNALNGKFTFRDSVSLPDGSDDGDNEGEVEKDEDYYQFTLTARTRVTSTLSNLGKNVNLGLFRSRNQRLEQSVNGGTKNESISRELGPGTYYIQVKPVAKGRARYKLDVTFDPVT